MIRFKVYFITFLTLGSTLLLTACNSKTDEASPYLKAKVETTFKEARADLKAQKYNNAAEKYEAILSYHPFTKEARIAQLEIIYAYYKDESYTNAYAAANDYINIHPNDKYLDYIYYLKGLINFEKSIDGVEKILDLDISKHDVSAFKSAFNDFDHVLKFKDSKYRADAKQRMVYIKNLLAKHELAIAKYYAKRNATIAALNRYQYLITNYPDTKAAYQALTLVPSLYKDLKLETNQKIAQEIIAYNKDALTKLRIS